MPRLGMSRSYTRGLDDWRLMENSSSRSVHRDAGTRPTEA